MRPRNQSVLGLREVQEMMSATRREEFATGRTTGTWTYLMHRRISILQAIETPTNSSAGLVGLDGQEILGRSRALHEPRAPYRYRCIRSYSLSEHAPGDHDLFCIPGSHASPRHRLSPSRPLRPLRPQSGQIAYPDSPLRHAESIY